VRKIIFYAALLLAIPGTPVTAHISHHSMSSLGKSASNAEHIDIAQGEETQYETYYNGRFDFSIQYPSNLLIPQSPPTNNDGRVFVSSERNIRMVVYGRHQVDQSLEGFYLSSLQFHDQQGAEVTYVFRNEEEFVISGYDSDGNVFYDKVLLRHGDFLTLSFTYDRSLQPELDSVVTDVSNSFRAVSDRSTYNHQVQIYFPRLDGENFVDVVPVVRATSRDDVAEFAIKRLIQGPTDEERDQVDSLPIQLRGTSVCGDQNFTVDLEGNTAIVQFCRNVIRGGVGDDVRLEQAFQSTLEQFSSIDQVVLLNKFGNCLIDPRGDNACLEKLPNAAQ